MNLDIGEILERAGVRQNEVANLVRTQRTIYCRRRFVANTAITANTAYRYFHAGIGDVSSTLGAAESEITRFHTNLEKGGAIPEGEVAIILGMSIELERLTSTAGLAAQEMLIASDFRYEEANGKVKLYLGEFVEFPPVYRPDYLLMQDSTATGAAAGRENYTRRGPANIGASPLFVMRGSDPETRRGSIIQEFTAGTPGTPTADLNVRARLHTLWFQRTGAHELARRSAA